MTSGKGARQRRGAGGAAAGGARGSEAPAPVAARAAAPEAAKALEAEAAQWRAFSGNADKAWAEKWFLAYSPVWPLLFGAWSMSGLWLQAGDAGNLAVTALIALPNVAVPALLCPSPLRWHETYWFKFSLWIGIFSFVASYFFTEYFFDVLGLVFNFPHLRWNLDSGLVGSGRQVVPVMMYLHAWYSFVTYHTCSVIMIRAIRTAPGLRRLPWLANVLSIALSAWLIAWGENFGFTLEAIREQFTYRDMDWALSWGALCYACYFVPSFPVVFGLDESPRERWSLRRTTESALAAAMTTFLLLDAVTQYVVTDWKTNPKLHQP
jgi:cycloeucalenol cycloisomerase